MMCWEPGWYSKKIGLTKALPQSDEAGRMGGSEKERVLLRYFVHKERERNPNNSNMAMAQNPAQANIEGVELCI